MAMDLNNHLPFRVGQQAEAKSFIEGYRSAWFRCKIKKISFRKGKIGHSLEFFDYPDEKVTWTKLYQKPSRQRGKASRESRMELMVRPCFPFFYHRSQLPDSYPKSDVIAIVQDTWKVGDLVDWWYSSCYWSGRVTQLLGKDKVQIQLPEPPIGEGKSYVALSKDLRPSLDWSPEHGWTVPRSREHGEALYCAYLIRPLTHEDDTNHFRTLVEDTMTRLPCEIQNSNENNAERNNTGMEVNTEEKVSCLYEGLNSHEGSAAAETLYEGLGSHDEGRAAAEKPAKALSRKDRYSFLDPFDMIQKIDHRHLRHSETIESSIMDLEELANKIRWLKGFLRFGFQWSNAMKPSWKFLENCQPNRC